MPERDDVILRELLSVYGGVRTRTKNEGVDFERNSCVIYQHMTSIPPILPHFNVPMLGYRILTVATSGVFKSLEVQNTLGRGWVGQNDFQAKLAAKTHRQ